MGQFVRMILVGLCLLCSNLALAASPQSALSTADTLFNQGKAYHDGLGVAQDFDVAHTLYERAAALGSADAQVNLGYIYFVGEGVPRNFTIARSWYEKAAIRGDKNAAENLAYMDLERLGLSPINKTPKFTVVTKPLPTALPTPSKVSENSNSKPRFVRNYNTLAALQNRMPEPKFEPQSSFSITTVFGSIILFAISLGGLVGWTADRMAAKKRSAVRMLAQQFFESNRRLLREIYIRHPRDASVMSQRECAVSVTVAVLIVRFIMFKTYARDVDEAPLPQKLSSQILKFAKLHPSKARHLAFTLVPDVINFIKSDIRAFDIEQTTATEVPPIYKSPRRNPRKLVWGPRLVASN